MRKKKRKVSTGSSMGVIDAERTGETTPVRQPRTRDVAHGTSTRGTADLHIAQRPMPEMVKTGFGPAYLAQRSRALAADEQQCFVMWWQFDIQGKCNWANPTPQFGNFYDGYKITQDWYSYTRNKGTVALKYKHVPATLSDDSFMRHYLNTCYYALANLTTLFSVSTLFAWNNALEGLNLYLPKHRGRMTRLWNRLQSRPMPPFLKAHAIRNGIVTWEQDGYPPFVRLWSESVVSGYLYGVSGLYTGQTAESPSAIFTTEAKLVTLLDNIEKAIQVIEGRVNSALAPLDDDAVAVTDLIDMTRDISPGTWTPGLPDPKEIKGAQVDLSVKNDLFCRGLLVFDTFGLGGDEVNGFPTTHLPEFREMAPILGWGQINQIYDFTFLGGTKFLELNNSSVGLHHTGESNPILMYGTDAQLKKQGTANVFTREDGWVTTSTETDWGDGQNIRETLNLGHYQNKHVWWQTLFFGQLDPDEEYRFVDLAKCDYKVYVDPADFGDNYAFFLSNALQVPYLGS